MAYQSRIARDALRRALRLHPDADSVLAGRRINNLPLGDLHICLAALGMVPADIIAAAMAAAPAAATRRPAREAPETEPEPEPEPDEAPEMVDNDPIETELQTIRALIGTGGFTALDARLRELVIEARKPPIEIMVPVAVAPGDGQSSGPVAHCARPTGRTASWRSLFHVHGTMGKRETALWDGSHPSTPRANDNYVWPMPQTAVALSQIARGRNVYFFGPHGTGKTEWSLQLAARTGRPFALISCDSGTDASTLVGMTVPDAAGGVSWQDGQLTRAIRTPGCVICIDEPSIARPGALFVLQNVLANRTLYIAETGERVSVAPGVVFIATDNTNGTGGGARKGYTDTNRLNAAFLDRFGVRVKCEYLPADKEAAVIVAYTGCTIELAKLLVAGAAVTRAAADNDQTLSHGIGLRRLLSWAELLTDGVDPEVAFCGAVLDCAPEQDRETLREQLLLTYDKATVAAALNPPAPAAQSHDPSLTNPTPAGRAAAADFQAANTTTTV